MKEQPLVPENQETKLKRGSFPLLSHQRHATAKTPMTSSTASKEQSCASRNKENKLSFLEFTPLSTQTKPLSSKHKPHFQQATSQTATFTVNDFLSLSRAHSKDPTVRGPALSQKEQSRNQPTMFKADDVPSLSLSLMNSI